MRRTIAARLSSGHVPGGASALAWRPGSFGGHLRELVPRVNDVDHL
jgi:hypothetical protein